MGEQIQASVVALPQQPMEKQIIVLSISSHKSQSDLVDNLLLRHFHLSERL